MKQIVASLLSCVFVLLPLAEMWGQNVQHRRKAFRGGGITWSNTLDSSGTGIFQLGNSSTREYGAFQFTADDTGTLQQITIHMTHMGTPETGESFTVQIWSNGSGEPGSLVSDGTSETIDYDQITGPNSYDDVVITWATGPTLTATTTYWVVMQADQIDALDYCRVHYNGGASEGEYNTGDSTPTWSLVDASAALRCVLEGN